MRKKKKSKAAYFFSFIWLVELPLKFYQKVLSPLIPSVCIYYPSCSVYMAECIKEYGFGGVILGLRRLLRCNTFSEGGYDPVPLNKKGDIEWLF